MTHEIGFSKLGEIATVALTRADRRASMSFSEIQLFDKDCTRYDFEVKEAKSSLLQMVNILPAPGVEQDPETRASIYWKILKTELSPCAIGKVCKKALAGQIGSPRWLPVPGELINFAKDNWIQIGPVENDPRTAPDIRSIPAPPEDKCLGREYGDEQFRADERARIGRQLRSFADEMRERSAKIAGDEKPDYTRRGQPVYSRQELKRMDAGEREKQRIEAETYLEAIRNCPPPMLSEEAREKLGSGISGGLAE